MAQRPKQIARSRTAEAARCGTYLPGVRLRCWHLSDGQENDFAATLRPGCVKRVSNRPHACSLLTRLNRDNYITRYGSSQMIRYSDWWEAAAVAGLPEEGRCENCSKASSENLDAVDDLKDSGIDGVFRNSPETFIQKQTTQNESSRESSKRKYPMRVFNGWRDTIINVSYFCSTNHDAIQFKQTLYSY